MHGNRSAKVIDIEPMSEYESPKDLACNVLWNGLKVGLGYFRPLVDMRAPLR